MGNRKLVNRKAFAKRMRPTRPSAQFSQQSTENPKHRQPTKTRYK